MTNDHNKFKGQCCSCHGTFRLQSNGRLYKHGHRDRPCSGSGATPADGSVFADTIASLQAPRSFRAFQSSQASMAPTVPFIIDQSHVYDESFAHPVRSGPVIKHLPHSARHASATLLSNIINDVVHNKGSGDKWRLPMNFA